MADNTIALKVQQLGAEGVRARLREINQELKAGKPVTKDLGKEMKELGTQVNAQSRIVKLNERAWLDSNRTLQTTGRVMSMVGSIARSVLSITTAFSVASIAFGRGDSQLMEAEANLARAHRELIAALESGDPEKIATAQENINVFTEKVKELKDQKLSDMASSILNIGASIALMGNAAFQAAKILGGSGFISKLGAASGALAALGTASWIALGPLLLIAAIVAGIAAAFYMAITSGDQVADFFKSFFPEASAQIDQFSKDVDDVFTMHIPNAFIFMANTALSVFDSIVMAAEGMVNGVISRINAIISTVNRVASFLRLPTIAAIPTVSFAGITGSRIDYLQSRNTGATGGSGSQPTFATVTRGGGSGAPAPTINITINGDVSGEELVDKTMKSFKDKLRDSGFTGFQ